MLDGTRTRAEVLALPPRARLQAPTCSTAVALSQPAGRRRPRLMEGQPRLDLGSGIGAATVGDKEGSQLEAPQWPARPPAQASTQARHRRDGARVITAKQQVSSKKVGPLEGRCWDVWRLTQRWERV